MLLGVREVGPAFCHDDPAAHLVPQGRMIPGPGLSRVQLAEVTGPPDLGLAIRVGHLVLEKTFASHQDIEPRPGLVA